MYSFEPVAVQIPTHTPQHLAAVSRCNAPCSKVGASLAQWRWMRNALLVLLSIASVAHADPSRHRAPLPKVIYPEDGVPMPDGYVAKTRPRITLLAVGGGVFLAGYVANLVVAASIAVIASDGCYRYGNRCDESTAVSFIPVVGPLLQMDPKRGNYPPALALVMAIPQALGLAGAALGFIFPQPIYVRERVVVNVTPTGLSGTF